MFRILVVDDERIIANGIRRMIEEDGELAFPKDIVTASNVPFAIELLESFEPDLILTDIRMPVKDGFELIRYVRERSSTMSIVILTSHTDFDYAQQAIRFGVMDFILKPIEQQLLRNAIRKVYEQKVEKERRDLCSVLQEVRNMMLYDLSAQELTSNPEQICNLFPCTYFTVIVLALPQLQDKYSELLQKILLRYYSYCYCFPLREKNQLIAICNHDQFHIRPVDLKAEFINVIQRDDFQIGISIGANSYKVLHNLYINAVQRIFYMRYFGEKSALAEVALLTYKECENIFLESEESKVMQRVQEYLTKIRATCETNLKAETIYDIFIHNILLHLKNNYIRVSDDLVNTTRKPLEHHELADVIVEQVSVLKSDIRKIYENTNNYGNEILINELLSYIRQHYREDISLDDLATHLGFHPNYVCALFKKSIGQSYLTCLHKERLREAKKMLTETDFVMERIAKEVGYNSASQLARIFRKYEGMSPSVFRSIRRE